eukprot:TRINITY_DN14793_c0_g1_i1.p1 TRINITY_DN14793_c0_g1~~TRINITY_DN14793_c0_g1_i1.p1  ORF type:complete len:123 (-),score=26.74 TRINITY_DN14793_c0_g1_i1:51-419(-)
MATEGLVLQIGDGLSVNEGLAVLLMATRRNLPVCGSGLSEVVPQLLSFDFAAVSGYLGDRTLDCLDDVISKHLENPQIVEGRYTESKLPGCSLKFREESLKSHEFPFGKAWRQRPNGTKVAS